MTPPQSTPATDTRTGPSRRPRAQAAQAREHFRDPGHASSQRQYAQEHGLPRSTLGHWLRQDPPDGLDPELAVFLGSVSGERFLRRLVLALLLVFHHENACGLRPLGHFLRLTQLDGVVASSYGALYSLATRLQADLQTFGKKQEPSELGSLVGAPELDCEIILLRRIDLQ